MIWYDTTIFIYHYILSIYPLHKPTSRAAVYKWQSPFKATNNRDQCHVIGVGQC